ncbi:MAG: beta-ketoacyl synthase chain length factor [Pseudomonadales bacterium]|nr:beta-ketoacyl synthase chain length factor [Pseudomonadales bacterium]
MMNTDKKNTPTFNVESWAAWTQGVQTPEQWQALLNKGYNLPKHDAAIKADVSFLPAMQRRRLSPLARAALNVANQCMFEQAACPSIFCSVYGETQRTYNIVKTIAEAEDVSPMAFSLSVHNAISGQFGILFNNTETTTALSPADNSYLSAFAEAQGLLIEGAESVLIVCYEENIPEFYQPYIVSVPQPVAIAIKISLATHTDKPGYQLSFEPQTNIGQTKDQEIPALLKLIDFFANNKQCLTQAGWVIQQR